MNPPTSTDPGCVAACVKWVDLSPETDPTSGLPVPSAHSWGFSEADRSAVEVALRLADDRGTDAVVVCVGPPEAQWALGELAAAGAARAVLVTSGGPGDARGGASSGETARILADILGPVGLDADTVVCGDISLDRGSGSVPALLAHHLELPQALGLISVDLGDRPRIGGATRDATTTLMGVRRLDGARRERVGIPARAVMSVEGAVAPLRRAPLGRAVEARRRVQRESSPRRPEPVRPARILQWRPPPRSLPAPEGTDAFERVVSLTGALEERTPPRVVELAPPQAAAEILRQLHRWGYLTDAGAAGAEATAAKATGSEPTDPVTAEPRP